MIIAVLVAAIVAVILVAGSGGGDDPDLSAPGTSNDTSDTRAGVATTATGPDTDEPDAPCGVTLAEIQALLPPDSGVTQNSTPDPGRCNFTWDDGEPRGIDVAIVPGGRAAFDVPDGYEPVEGYGDEAFEATGEGRASAVAFVGDDLYAADVVTGGTSATDDDLRNLCLQLLELALE